MKNNVNAAEQLLRFISGPALSVCLQTNKLLSCNDSARRLLGFSNDELIGSKLALIIPDYDSIKRKVYAYSSSESQHPFSVKLVKVSGAKTNVEVNIIPFFNNNNDLAIVAIKPKPSQEPSSIVLNSDSTFFIKNPLPLIMVEFSTFEIVSVNPKAQTFLGYEKQEFISANLTDFIASDSNDIVNDIKSFINKSYTGLEEAFITKSNERKDVALQYHVIEDNGRCEVLFSLVDITARNQALKALREIQGNLANEVKEQTTDLIRINNTLLQQIKTRKAAEEEVRQSQEIFHRLFELNPNGILLKTFEKGAVVEVNKSFRKIFNFSQSELLAGKVGNDRLFCDPSEYEDLQKKLAIKGFIRNAKLNMLSREGHVRFVVYNGEVVKLGGQQFLLEVYQDITEIHITQEKLADSEKRYRTMFNNALVGIYRVEESTGIILNSNKQFANILGYSTDNDIIGRSILSHYQPDGTREKLVNLLKKKGSGVLEYKLITKDTETVWIVNYARYYKSEGFIDGVVVDVSERKRIETLLKNSEHRFRSLIENATDVILIVNNVGRALYLSPSVEKELGYPIDKADKPNLYRYIHPDDIEIAESLLKSKAEEGKLQEVRIKHSNGTYRLFEFSYTNLLNNPAVNGIVINARDITERAKAKDEINFALQQEQELSRQKTQFISTVSHEFRTPLTNISLNIQLLQKYIQNNRTEKAKHSLTRMANAIKRLTALLSEVSLIGKEQSGRLQFAPEECSLHAFIDEILDQISYLLLPNVKLEVDMGEDSKVLADKNLILHILGNLLSNAIKYSPKDKDVLLKLEADKKMGLNIMVEDEGIGIPEEELKFLYDPYFRASNVKNVKGAGLGMSIVKRCVDLLEADFKVFSEENNGTRVVCKIPLTILK
ncbi:MAG: PAS domain S-box protein [Bacteroidales bacterium]